MHLALAEDILRGDDLPPATRRLLIQQHGPFLLGHTAPDVQNVSGQTREETHFYPIPRHHRRERSRPAYETLFAAHAELGRVHPLRPPQAAFVAGYIAHLLLDELWLDAIFLPYFRQDGGGRREQAFLHNVLRTWMDRQDSRRIEGTLTTALRQAKPRQWLPFVADEDLRAWRDWLVEQLGPGQRLQTAEVFAQRMGVLPREMEAVAQSPQQMEARIFSHIPRAVLQSFRDKGYTDSVALVEWYLGAR